MNKYDLKRDFEVSNNTLKPNHIQRSKLYNFQKLEISINFYVKRIELMKTTESWRDDCSPAWT